MKSYTPEFIEAEKALEHTRQTLIEENITPPGFRWKGFFESSSTNWENTPMEQKARVLAYLEANKEGKEILLYYLTEKYIIVQKEKNRKDIIPLIPYTIEEIRKERPENP